MGQRKGLGGGHGRRLYVLGSRPATREVVVGTLEQLHRSEFSIGELNWLATPPQPGEQIGVQIRHRAPAVGARVVGVGESDIELVLDAAQRAVTPGQSAVLFQDDIVLGGGRIAR